MNTTTPKRSKTGTKLQSTTCDDVEEEFSKRFLSIFTSLYDTPIAEPILSFPPVSRSNASQTSEIKNKKNIKSPPFNATVWDLRLKKTVDSRQSIIESASDAVDQEADKLFDKFLNPDQNNDNNNKSDLYECFQSNKVARPEVPKYMQNIQQDIKIENERKKHQPTPLNLSEAEKQFQQRLQKQKQKEADHKKKLLERQSKQEKEHMEFLKTLPKTKTQESKKSVKSDCVAKHQRALELLNKRRKGVNYPPMTKNVNSVSEKSASKTPEDQYYPQQTD